MLWCTTTIYAPVRLRLAGAVVFVYLPCINTLFWPGHRLGGLALTVAALVLMYLAEELTWAAPPEFILRHQQLPARGGHLQRRHAGRQRGLPPRARSRRAVAEAEPRTGDRS
jgi:hypothetical protein